MASRPAACASLLLLCLLLAGCASGSGTESTETPHFACPAVDIGPGLYVHGSVWRDGKPAGGAAAYAHGPNGTTVEGDAGDDGCFMLQLPEPGHWEGEARYDEWAGPFAVHADGPDGYFTVVVVLEKA